MVKALAIVAHPDDETIWMGGTILMHPEWDWAILSLCRAFDKDRAPKFRKVCAKLGARCAISDLEDEHPEQKLASLEEVKARVRKMLEELDAGSSFDVLYTHGANGEYEHNRHKEVHRAVRELVESGELKASEVFFFAYEHAQDGFYCAARAREKGASERSTSVQAFPRSASERRARRSRVVTRLNARIAREKALLITSAYEFSKESFESRSCSAVESFEVLRACDR